MSDQTTQKEKVMGKINEIKKNVETFIADVNVNELKESLNTMVKDAQKDFSNLVDKDLGALKTKFAKEKSILEKKAKKFYEGHKKEICCNPKYGTMSLASVYLMAPVLLSIAVKLGETGPMLV
jgi:hypothetical protein